MKSKQPKYFVSCSFRGFFEKQIKEENKQRRKEEKVSGLITGVAMPSSINPDQINSYLKTQR